MRAFFRMAWAMLAPECDCGWFDVLDLGCDCGSEQDLWDGEWS